MAAITVSKEDNNWVAIAEGRVIGKAPCKSCMVNIVQSVMKSSRKYTILLVINEDHSRTAIPIGAANAGTAQESI